MRPPLCFLLVPAGLSPLAALPPQPLLLVHVETDGLTQELAHGAVFFSNELPDLLVHLRRSEKVMAFLFRGMLSCLMVKSGHTLIMDDPGCRCQGSGICKRSSESSRMGR